MTRRMFALPQAGFPTQSQMPRRGGTRGLGGMGGSAEDVDPPKSLPPVDHGVKPERARKADHEANLKDLKEIDRLVDLVRKDLEKYDRHVLSLTSLKNLQDIGKTARRIHSRLRRM